MCAGKRLRQIPAWARRYLGPVQRHTLGVGDGKRSNRRLEPTAHQLAMKTSGARVSVAFVWKRTGGAPDDPKFTVHVRESTNHGSSVTWGSVVPGAAGIPTAEHILVDELDIAHSAGGLAIFVKNTTGIPSVPVLHQSQFATGSIFPFGPICTPGSAEGPSDYCGRSISRFATAASAQFITLAAVDSSSTVVEPPRVASCGGSAKRSCVAWPRARAGLAHGTFSRFAFIDATIQPGPHRVGRCGVWRVDG